MHGDALEFIDWAVLWMLWYVLFLESYGLPKMRTDPNDDPVAGTPADTTAVTATGSAAASR